MIHFNIYNALMQVKLQTAKKIILNKFINIFSRNANQRFLPFKIEKTPIIITTFP